MSYVILSYDLHGNDKSKDRFLRFLMENGWTDHVMREGALERLPNTTLFTLKNLEAAERDFVAARALGRGEDPKFKVTHWTLGPYSEFFGGVDPVPIGERLASLRDTISKT